jgi:hypothetical protein
MRLSDAHIAARGVGEHGSTSSEPMLLLLRAFDARLSTLVEISGFRWSKIPPIFWSFRFSSYRYSHKP